MKYCPTSTVVRNPASVQSLLNLSCCDNFSIRSLYLCNINSSCAGSPFKGMFVLITLGTNDGLDCPLTTGSPLTIVKGFIFFTHFCDCSVKTELIYRKNCAKISFNRFFKVGAIVYRQFSTTFALKHTSAWWNPCIIRPHCAADGGARGGTEEKQGREWLALCTS